MADTLPKHPAYMFRDVMLDYWDPDNAAGLDPRKEPAADLGLSMTRGWYTTVDFDPHVALTNFREPVGSDSRYTSITGGRPAQQRAGSGMATAFAEGDSSYGDSGETAESITDMIRKELERATSEAMGDGALPRPWENLAATWDDESVDQAPTPPVWQQQVSIYYHWNKIS